MKTPVRAGTLASTLLLLLVVFTVLRHSEYLRDRWNHMDEIKSEIAAQLGSSGSRTTSIDPKYIGFGTPKPTTTRLRAQGISTPQATATPDGNQNTLESDKVSTTTNGATDEHPPTLGTEVEYAAVDEAETDNTHVDGALKAQPDKIVVMGKTAEEDTSWVAEYLPDWQHAIYSVDDQNATLHTPKNKGKEAMAYLTYLVENYGNFPSMVAFIHSHKDRFWHAAGMPARSNMAALKALNIDHVQRAGFANLRCTLGPGCPAEVQPYRQDTPDNRMYEKSMASVWELFFGTECPEVIAAPCCAQFAVSRDQIMARPVEDYVLYRQWLMETELDDDNSGRVLEYTWHIIFGQEPVHCPDFSFCWANVYGGLSMSDLHNLMYADGSV